MMRELPVKEIVRIYLAESGFVEKGITARCKVSKVASMMRTRWRFLAVAVGARDVEYAISSILNESKDRMLDYSGSGDRRIVETYLRDEWKYILRKIPLTALGELIINRSTDRNINIIFGRSQMVAELDEIFFVKISNLYYNVRNFPSRKEELFRFLSLCGEKMGFSIEESDGFGKETGASLYPCNVIVQDARVDFKLVFVNIDGPDISFSLLKSYFADRSHDLFLVLGVGSGHGGLGILKKLVNRLSNCVFFNSLDLRDILFEKEADRTSSFGNQIIESLHPATLSPYTTEGQVENKNMFFGRSKEIAELSNRDRSFCLLGARRIGKSSILNEVRRRHASNDSLKVVSVDCTAISTLAAFQEIFITELVVGDFDFPWVEPEEADFFTALQAKLVGSGLKFLFLFDEVDTLFKEHPCQELFEFVRAITNSKSGRFIIAGYRGLSDVVRNQMSPLYNLLKKITVGSLADPDCRDLVVMPMSRIRVSIDNDATVNKIIRHGTRIPYLLQLLCNTLLSRLEFGKARVITSALVDEAASSIAFRKSVSEAMVEDTNDEMGPLAQLIMFLMARSSYSSLSEEDIVNDIEKHVYRISLSDVVDAIQYLIDTYRLREVTGGYAFQIAEARDLIRSSTNSIDYKIKRLSEEVKRDN